MRGWTVIEPGFICEDKILVCLVTVDADVSWVIIATIQRICAGRILFSFCPLSILSAENNVGCGMQCGGLIFLEMYSEDMVASLTLVCWVRL